MIVALVIVPLVAMVVMGLILIAANDPMAKTMFTGATFLGIFAGFVMATHTLFGS